MAGRRSLRHLIPPGGANQKSGDAAVLRGQLQPAAGGQIDAAGQLADHGSQGTAAQALLHGGKDLPGLAAAHEDQPPVIQAEGRKPRRVKRTAVQQIGAPEHRSLETPGENGRKGFGPFTGKFMQAASAQTANPRFERDLVIGQAFPRQQAIDCRQAQGDRLAGFSAPAVTFDPAQLRTQSRQFGRRFTLGGRTRIYPNRLRRQHFSAALSLISIVLVLFYTV